MARSQLSGNTNANNYFIELSLTKVREDVASNSTTIKATLIAGANKGWGYFASYSNTVTLNFNGQTDSVTINYFEATETKPYKLFEKEYTVSNSTTSQTIRATATYNGYFNGSVSESITIEPVVQKSTATFAGNTIGSATRITINRQSENVIHTITYNWNDKTGTIATNNATGLAWTIPASFANDIPTSESGQLRITITSFLNGSSLGNITYLLNVKVPDASAPTFTGFTLADTNTAVTDVIGTGTNFLQTLSQIKAFFSGASGSYGSTIVGYRAEIVGKNQTITANNGVFPSMNWSGTVKVRGYVIDSRGRQSASKEISINVLPYTPPGITFTAERGTTTQDGNKVNVRVTTAISPLTVGNENKNLFNLVFSHAELGAKNFVEDAKKLTNQTSNMTNSNMMLASEFATNKSFTIRGTISDRFTSTTYETTIGTENVVLSYDQQGVAINKIRERGALDVRGDTYIDGHLVGNGGMPIGMYAQKLILNLNTATVVGIYRVEQKPTGSPLPNVNIYGFVEVLGAHRPDETIPTDTSSWLFQRLWTTSGRIFVRQRINKGSWTAWKEIQLNTI